MMKKQHRGSKWVSLAVSFPALLILAATAAAPPAGAGQEAKEVKEGAKAKKVKLAVKALDRKGVEENVASVISGRLCTALQKRDDLEVLCADDLKALMELKATELALGACGEDDCLDPLIRASKADRLLTGDLGRVGKLYVINLKLIEGQDGKVIKGAGATVKGDPAKLMTKIPQLIEEIFGKQQKK